MENNYINSLKAGIADLKKELDGIKYFKGKPETERQQQKENERQEKLDKAVT